MEWFLLERLYANHPMNCYGYLRYPSMLDDKFKLEVAILYKHRRLSLIYPVKRFEEISKEIVEIIKNNPDWYKSINNDLRKKVQQWKRYCDELKLIDFSKLSNSELIELYKKFFDLYIQGHGLGYYGNMIDFKHEYFTNFAKDIIFNRIKELNIEIDPTEGFILLSTPVEESYYEKERSDFRKIFLKTYNSDINDPEIQELIKKHYEKYLWLPYMYEGPAWDLNYFISKMKLMLKEETPETLERKERREDLLKRKRNALLKTLEFSHYENKIIDLMQETIFLKGWRKDVFFYSCFVINEYFEEVGKRLNLTLDEVRYFLPEEMLKSLETGEADKELLDKRFEKSLYYIDRDGKETFYLGNEAENRFKELYEEEKLENVSELKGSCAYQGNVKGKVKIVNHASDIYKVEKGDILVSHSTNPNLVPAMERAAAFVTDVGGITCHAAIVSREMKKPCVIGTNNATTVLQDGDMIEVDATNGIVKKL